MPKVLATLHIAELPREPRMDIPTRLDWAKIPRILRGEWPRLVPEYAVDPGHRGMHEWFEGALAEAPWVVVDTEYNPETSYLTLVGIGYGEVGLQMTTPTNNIDFKLRLGELVQSVPVVFQNAMADVPILRHAFGIQWGDYHQYDDTMQAHAVLYPEWPHTLEFLASIYGNYPKMKHLARHDPLRYNKGDVLETISSWEALLRELAKDPASEKVYREQNLRLLPWIEESQRVGLRVNQARVESALAEFSAKRDEAGLVAEAYCGYPINLGSDEQVARWLYEIEGMKVQKHGKTRNPTVNKDAVAVLRGAILPFDPQDEATVEKMHERIGQGGHPLLEARVVHSGAEQVISHYLAPLVEGG